MARVNKSAAERMSGSFLFGAAPLSAEEDARVREELRKEEEREEEKRRELLSAVKYQETSPSTATMKLPASPFLKEAGTADNGEMTFHGQPGILQYIANAYQNDVLSRQGESKGEPERARECKGEQGRAQECAKVRDRAQESAGELGRAQ